MRVVAIIQARMGSTRLPGKVMRPLSGKPMLQRVTERVRRAPLIQEVLVATSTLPEEQPIVDLCAEMSVRVVRGSPDDVLARYQTAAAQSEADTIVRITSDCPLISPGISGKVVAAFAAAGGSCDYASNVLLRTYPRGLDTEVFSRVALEAAFAEATAQPDREHVTPFIWRQPQRFRLLDVVDHDDHNELRWTVDTPEDYELVRRIYDAFGPERTDFDYRDILAVLAVHPEWTSINSTVKQKHYGE